MPTSAAGVPATNCSLAPSKVQGVDQTRSGMVAPTQTPFGRVSRQPQLELSMK